MELTNEFEVPVAVAEAWKVLTDVERIAPCLPGAQLQEVEGDEYRGTVKVKVGPITASYKGTARFEELDASSHKAVLKAQGRESRGQGNASATITATLEELGEGRTKVGVVTELDITGKVAQFGRGVLGDVSESLLAQFAKNLETTVLSPFAAAPEAPAASTAAKGEETDRAPEADAPRATGHFEENPQQSPEVEPERPEPAVRRIDHPEPEPVDIGGPAGASLAKRLLPYASAAGALFLLRIVVYAMRRRKK